MPTLDTPHPAWLSSIMHFCEGNPAPSNRILSHQQEILRHTVKARITAHLAEAGADPDSCAAVISDWRWMDCLLHDTVLGLDSTDEDALCDLIVALMHWWDMTHAGTPTPSAGTLFPQLFRRAADHYRVESVAFSILTQGEPSACPPPIASDPSPPASPSSTQSSPPST